MFLGKAHNLFWGTLCCTLHRRSSESQTVKDDHALTSHTPTVCSKMVVPVLLKEQLQLLLLFVSLLSLSSIYFLLDKCSYHRMQEVQVLCDHLLECWSSQPRCSA